MTFCDIFPLFLAQNFKTKVLTAQKNLLLECLAIGSVGYGSVLPPCNISTVLVTVISSMALVLQPMLYC